MKSDILLHLNFLYGTEVSAQLLDRVNSIINFYPKSIPSHHGELSEQDSIMITYGDQVHERNEKTLRTLGKFCDEYIHGIVKGIHILPFFPWSSDDGFSVTDYRQVDENLGSWEDVSALGKNFRLMFDAVINHISVQSEWFKGFLQDDPHYQDFFISLTGSPDLSKVIRPRALPLLTPFVTPSGKKMVWTTFSSDQVDLNYKNPEVLLEILDILLMYVERGATFIRLDAIAFLWKEIGTTCLHLPQTHHVIQFLRAVLNDVAPYVQLITETNVPHADNISYFGDGSNEAHLVYNFALPPLTLHALHQGDASLLSMWAKTLELPSNQTTFFNFLASHDGIGLNPVRGILTEKDIEALVKKTLAHGGLISYKNNPDGTQSPYEMNINYFDALSNPDGSEPLDLQIRRFMVSQAIMLSLIGVPGIYFHSLFGSRSWLEGVSETGFKRTINRQKYALDEIQSRLADKNSLCSKVFTGYCQLLLARRSNRAFHPYGTQKILNLHPAVFAIERISPDGGAHVVCLHNVSGQGVEVSTEYGHAEDLLTGLALSLSTVKLEPYQVLWVNL